MSGTYIRDTPYSMDSLIDDYIVKEMTIAEMAIKYDRSYKAIHQAMVSAGIPRRSKAIRNQDGDRNSAWAGNRIGYFGAHKRVRKIRGTPMHCERCGVSGFGRRYEWASISGNWNDPNDYFRLCKRCHNIRDGIAGNVNGNPPERKTP